MNDRLEYFYADDLDAINKWLSGHGLPKVWLMQVHPDNYGNKEVEKMRQALVQAELAINPRDKGMISMAIWQDRLKAATDNIFAALGEKQ